MPKLMRIAKRGSDKVIEDSTCLSVGFNADSGMVRINLLGHYVEVSADELSFMVKQLPIQQLKLNDKLLRDSENKALELQMAKANDYYSTGLHL
jgi:hypothetical protein